MPPVEATHNLLVKLLTPKADGASTDKILTSSQTDLTRTAVRTNGFTSARALAKERKKGGGDNTKYVDGEKED